MKRVAVHEVVVHTNDQTTERLTMAVVELEGDLVTTYYPLNAEQPMTEWWGGTIEIKHQSGGIMKAYRNGKIIKESYNPKSK